MTKLQRGLLDDVLQMIHEITHAGSPPLAAVMQNGRLVEDGFRDAVFRSLQAEYIRTLFAAVGKHTPTDYGSVRLV